MNLLSTLKISIMTVLTLTFIFLFNVFLVSVYYNLTTHSAYIDNFILLFPFLILFATTIFTINKTSILFVNTKLIKKETFNKCLLFVFIIFATLILLQSEKLINYSVKEDYKFINNQILKNKNVENSIKYKQFLVDMKNNNKEKLSKYLNKKLYIKRINDDFISINDDQYILLVMASKNISLDPNMRKEIDKVFNDNFVSISEYKELKEYIINKKETYPEVAYLMRAEK